MQFRYGPGNLPAAASKSAPCSSIHSLPSCQRECSRIDSTRFSSARACRSLFTKIVSLSCFRKVGVRLPDLAYFNLECTEFHIVVGQAFQPAVRLDVIMLDENGRLESLPHKSLIFWAALIPSLTGCFRGSEDSV